MRKRLIPVKDERDIPKTYRNTPIERLFQRHNLGAPMENHERAELLILMCMDGRQELRLPGNFAFVVRNSGARLEGNSFSVSFAIACGGVQHIAVIGHSDCKIIDLESRKDEFIKGLTKRAGWKKSDAEKYFLDLHPSFKKKDAVNSVISEADIIRFKYPGIVVAPLFYSLEDDHLYLVEEKQEK